MSRADARLTRVLELTCLGYGPEAAGAAVGVDRRTVQRWRSRHADRLDELRLSAAREGQGILHAGYRLAVQTLVAACRDAPEWSDRISAGRAILGAMHRSLELDLQRQQLSESDLDAELSRVRGELAQALGLPAAPAPTDTSSTVLPATMAPIASAAAQPTGPVAPTQVQATGEDSAGDTGDWPAAATGDPGEGGGIAI